MTVEALSGDGAVHDANADGPSAADSGAANLGSLNRDSSSYLHSGNGQLDSLKPDSPSPADPGAVKLDSLNPPSPSKEGLALELECTFIYPCGPQDPSLELFDIRPEICRSFGACHGDIVLGGKGMVATVIGVKLNRKGVPLLWSHANGAKGAGLFDPAIHLRVVARCPLVPEGGPEQLEDEESPQSCWWLEENFGYRCGLTNPIYALFDVRDEICKKVGGFKHGDVVRTQQGRECVAIGVRQDPADGTVALWFHPKHMDGAGVFDFDCTTPRFPGLELVGQEVVEEISPGSLPNAIEEVEQTRPETYPFPDPDLTLHCDATGAMYNVATHLSKAPDVQAVVVFFPGVHGGVGPGRTPGQNYDPNAIFPTLARRISSEHAADCYRVSWQAMFPSMGEGLRGGLMVVHHALARTVEEIHEAWKERHEDEPLPSIQVVLVGHSFGGAAALQCAKFLHTRIFGDPGPVPVAEISDAKCEGSDTSSDADAPPECPAERPPVFCAARLVGLATLAAQFRGAVEAVDALDERVAKAFVHGTEDAILPVDTVHTLYEQACEPKELLVIEGAGHDMQPYKDRVLEFLDDFIRPKCGAAYDPGCATVGEEAASG